MAISKVIHFLWMSETKDARTEACLKTWREVLADYEIREWSSKTFPYNDFLWTRSAAAHKKWAFVTDFFRLWVLENYGGIYLDADIVLHKNFDDLLEHQFFIGTEYTAQLGSHCMGSVPHHPFVQKCLEFYKDREYTHDIPIPRIMTYVLQKMYGYNKSLANFSNKPICIGNAENSVTVYPDHFFTLNISDNKNVATHLGMGSWRDNPTDNPVYTNVLERYFVKRFYLSDFFPDSRVKRLVSLLLPTWAFILLWKNKLKVKNLPLVQQIKRYCR